MAKDIYVGDSDTAKVVTDMYVGVNDVARRITKAYVGVNGVAQQIYEYLPNALTTEENQVITDETGTALDFESVPYTMLEWIESTGTQYINTGFKHTSNTRFLFECDITFAPNVKWQGICGSMGNSSKSASFCPENYDYPNMGTNVYFYYGGTGSYVARSNLTGRKVWDLNKNVWTIGTNTWTQSVRTFTSEFYDYIFTHTASNGNVVGITPAKLYYFKIYENDVLVRDFIPVLDENNVACLYDKVEEKFYYNQGTEDFIPSETSLYKAVNYLESNGTQYIDTGFKHNQNTRFTGEFEFLNRVNWSYPHGAFGGARGTNRFFAFYSGSGGELRGTYANATTYQFASSMVQRFAFDLNKNTFTLGTVSYTFTASTFQSEYNFYLFCSTGYEGEPVSLSGNKRFYNVIKLYDSGTLARCFVPCIRKSDNEPCLYDLVTQQFYTNAGTGTFLYG